jgi:hypothetical protein
VRKTAGAVMEEDIEDAGEYFRREPGDWGHGIEMNLQTLFVMHKGLNSPVNFSNG